MSGVGGSRYLPVRLALIAGALVALVLAVTSAAGVGPLQAAIDALVDAVGYDWALAAALGVLAVVAGLAVYVSGRGGTMRQAEMPTVERPVPVPSAGEPFDETLGGWRFATRIFGGETAESVRERLRAAAVTTIATEEGCSRAAAERRVEEGTWTNDEAAAAFLAGRYTPLGTWLVALANGETGPALRARRTVAAIVALREGDGGDRARTDRAEGTERTGEVEAPES